MEIKTLWKEDKTNNEVYAYNRFYLHIFEYNNRKFKIKLLLRDTTEGFVFEGGIYIMKDGIFEDAKIMEDVFIVCYEKDKESEEKENLASEETDILFNVTTELNTEYAIKFENEVVKYIKAVY